MRDELIFLLCIAAAQTVYAASVGDAPLYVLPLNANIGKFYKCLVTLHVG